jgi:hypothetical protein
LAPGKDAVIQVSQSLIERVLAKQASPLGTVTGSVHHDDADERVATDSQGRLELENTKVVFSSKQLYTAGALVGTTGQIVDRNPLGDDVVYIEETEFSLSAGPFKVDLAASLAAAGKVVLTATASVTYRTVSHPVKTIEPKGPPEVAPYGPAGDLYRALGLPTGPLVVSAGPASVSSSSGASGDLRLVATLATSVDASTRAIDVVAQLGTATVSFSSSDQTVSRFAPSIERAVRETLSRMSAPGGALLLAPRISLVGALGVSGAVNELNVTAVEASFLAAAGAHPACLSVAVRLAGGGSAGAPQNFLDGDYSYLCGESVIKALCAYRWRTGEYPTGYLGQPTSDSYTADGATKQIKIYTRLTQTDVLDGGGNVVGDLKQFGAGGAVQEDYVEIGGHAFGKIDSITDTNGQPVPQEIRDKYGDTAPFDYRLPTRLSNVGTPASHPDPAVDAYMNQMRAKVTGQFSRPFVGSPSVTLLKRAVNGIDRRLLSQGTVTAL